MDHVVGGVRMIVLCNKARIFGVTVRIFAVGALAISTSYLPTYVGAISKNNT